MKARNTTYMMMDPFSPSLPSPFVSGFSPESAESVTFG